LQKISSCSRELNQLIFVLVLVLAHENITDANMAKFNAADEELIQQTESFS